MSHHDHVTLHLWQESVLRLCAADWKPGFERARGFVHSHSWRGPGLSQALVLQAPNAPFLSLDLVKGSGRPGAKAETHGAAAGVERRHRRQGLPPVDEWTSGELLPVASSPCVLESSGINRTARPGSWRCVEPLCRSHGSAWQRSETAATRSNHQGTGPGWKGQQPTRQSEEQGRKRRPPASSSHGRLCVSSALGLRSAR